MEPHGRVFKVEYIFLRESEAEERAEIVFPVNSMYYRPNCEDRAHTAVIPKLSASVLNSSLCSYMFGLPLGSLFLCFSVVITTTKLPASGIR